MLGWQTIICCNFLLNIVKYPVLVFMLCYNTCGWGCWGMETTSRNMKWHNMFKYMSFGVKMNQNPIVKIEGSSRNVYQTMFYFIIVKKIHLGLIQATLHQFLNNRSDRRQNSTSLMDQKQLYYYSITATCSTILTSSQFMVSSY